MTAHANNSVLLPVHDYDLAGTLTSGQAFRWTPAAPTPGHPPAFEGVIGRYWVRLAQDEAGIQAQTAASPSDWNWLTFYLQTEVNLPAVVATFPDDEPMRNAVARCRGLRLLRQDPWECLASFILSSTKQIVQIQQIVAQLCVRFGDPLLVPQGHPSVYSFPGADRLAACAEPDLRACKMGFRAPNLLRTAKMVASGDLDLESLRFMSVNDAREQLLRCPGVGNKIANCVLLFAYGFQEAFPVDVWVLKALRHLYFPRRAVSVRRLERFTATHFGPNAGYAQQYLFHYMRTQHVPLPAKRQVRGKKALARSMAHKPGKSS